MKHALVALLLGCALAGCSGVGSVHPIYTQEDTVSLSGVLGTWTTEDQKGVLVISSGPHGSFTLRFTEDDGSLNTFRVHLTKIGGELFGDLFSLNGSKDAPLCMPVHLFAKVELKEGSFRLLLPSMEWFDSYLNRRPCAIRHVKLYEKGEQGWLYLTDSTKQVRAFIKKCARHPEAFVGDMTFTKISDSQELPPAPPPADPEK